jgi:mannose-1-phosphate guanylyltransferase
MMRGKTDKPIAVIMAGGSGERFWPLSRYHMPKQLLRLTSEDKTMLQEAVERVLPSVPSESVFVATARHLREAICTARLGIPDDNILAEPCKRNTAGCLIYAAANVLARYGQDSDPVMAVLTADHQIGDSKKFSAIVDSCLRIAAQQDALITIGIAPTRPETGYGYIEIAEGAQAMAEADGVSAWPVCQFREKPDADTAAEYLATGRHLWNSGMFFWRVSVFQKELAAANPVMAEALNELTASIKRGDEAETERIFTALESISIDYALFEKAKQVHVVRCDFTWDDVGSWDALARTLPLDGDGNVTVGDPVLIDSENCIVYNDAGADNMAVSVIGGKDMVVITTKDSVLVVPRDRVQEVRVAVEELKKRNAKQV